MVSKKRISNEAARELYGLLCDGDTSSVANHPAVEAFYAELTATHPEIDTLPDEKIGDLDSCPWSCKLDHSPGHVIMSCVWPKASDVDLLVHNLASKHGLAVYDPQDEEVTYPDGSTGGQAKAGMSLSARWILGLFALLFAAILIYSEQLAPSRVPWLVYVLAAFCGLIALACFSRTWRGAAIRIIGFMVFLAYASYVVHELFWERAKPYTGRSEPHWLNAILGLIVYGLPGLYFAVGGLKWGKGRGGIH